MSGSLPARLLVVQRRLHALLPAALATYCGGAACAPPQYVADQHAAIQSPVTVGEGNTGKPSLEELQRAGEPEPPAPVHQPPRGDAPTDANSTNTPPAAPRPDPAAPVDVPALLGRGPAREPAQAPPGGGPRPAADSAPAPFDPRATPDPELAATDVYYELTLRYCEGGVHLLGSRRVKLAKSTTLPRYMGRFAAELWIGHELLERARFEFPGVGADSFERTEPPPLQMGPRADVVWKVKVADRVRATQAWIIDRATGERWLLDWPPAESAAKPTADAPCPSFDGK